VPPVLRFVAEQAGHGAAEAYGTLNMGAGFALFVAAGDAARCVEVAREHGVAAWLAGHVEAGPKRLLVEPLGLVFGDDALRLR
jgi:phosphoribosylformylglycinamidine cyclo-ligase